MSQTYTIKDCRKGRTEKDSYGEYQNYALALDGHGEPVKLRRSIDKPAPEIGDILHGSLQEFEVGGRIYYNFVTEARPVPPPMTTHEAIMSQFAIKLAVECYLAGEPSEGAYANIQTEAKHFYNMIPNIRGDQTND